MKTSQIITDVYTTFLTYLHTSWEDLHSVNKHQIFYQI